jgi:hypothetical protein
MSLPIKKSSLAPRWATAVAICLLGAAALAPGARASQGIEDFQVFTSNTEAGGHPDLETRIALQNPGGAEAAENLTVNLPEGLFGNPQAITTCSSAEFAQFACPIGSQAGIVTVRGSYAGNPDYLLGTAPVFDLQTRASEETARLAFIVPILNLPINIPIAVRTGSDYGLRMTVLGITQSLPLASSDITVWGLPAASANDTSRFAKGSPGNPAGCALSASALCASNNGQAPHPANSTIAPFIDNPSICSGEPLEVTLDVQTYQDPKHLSHASASYPPTTECESQTFKPSLKAALTSEAADSPSGLDMQFNVPQFESLAASPSDLHSVTVVLPEGLSINPDAADGQRDCTEAEANFGTEAPAACPDNSKIGDFEVLTPALTGPLIGSLYFGEPKPGNQYRVFMVADGFGIHAKLVTSVHPDPVTGRLTIDVPNLPQVPFAQFNVHLFASDRGLVATPTACSVYSVEAVFTPWNAALAPQQLRPNLFVESGPDGSPCPGSVRPFFPRLVAGTTNPTAGAFSDFHLRLDRDDGDQFLKDINFRMPPGFTGSLRGIPYCSDAAISSAATRPGRMEQEAPSCPAASQIGTTNVAAGPGSHPFHAVGKMYLTGPFEGAPLSLAVITPALAGPYDYGTIVVRVALHVDAQLAQVSAVSGTVPSIVGGVPIRLRSISVDIEREDFTINPTNCSPFAIESQGIGDQGTVTNFSSYFHAVNCYALPFKPRMSVSMVGSRKALRRSANPTLNFDLFTRPGDANIKAISVTLPSAFEIDQSHLGNICTEKELIATQCAGRQAIGEATTTTPLLDQPLSGPVYAVSGSGGLPRLAFLLNGQVDLLPRAETTTLGSSGRLQTTVPVVPDAPIGHFHLRVFGGHQGYLQNTRDLCKHVPVIEVGFDAQNGRELTRRVPLKTACAAKRKRHKARRP